MSLPHDNEEMLGGIRVLVVDDCMVVRELMSLTLTPMGAKVDVAGSGEDALRMMEGTNYDIVFLDVMLPGIDGNRVCKCIKRDTKTRHIPVVMLTSRDAVLDKVRGMMSGADVYLTKPLVRSALLSAMKRCLPEWDRA